MKSKLILTISFCFFSIAQSKYDISISQEGVIASVYSTTDFLGSIPYNDEIFLTSGQDIYIDAEGYKTMTLNYD